MDNFNIKKIKWLKGWKDLPEAYYPLKVPGVTTIIGDLIPDPEYDQFVKDVGEEKAKQITEAAWDRGHAMHAFFEHFIKKLAETKDPSEALQHTQTVTPTILIENGTTTVGIDKGRDMFFNFYYSDYSNKYVDLIGTELAIYSPKYFFRGLTDVFYNERGIGRVVTDFKTTSKQIEKGTTKWLKYHRQLGAYAVGIEDMFEATGKEVKVNKSSILAVHTKSNLIQEITCEGSELEEQKNEFKTLCIEWHKTNGQSFLFND